MKREEIINIIRSERSVQIPSLQQKYSIPYGEIKAVIDDMVLKGELVYMGGIRYDYAYPSGNYGRTYVSPEYRSAPNGGREEKYFKTTTIDEYFAERKRKALETNDDLSVDSEKESLFNVNFDVNDEWELKKQALKLCIKKNYASISLLQRSFPIGYSRAGKIVDWMEEQGYITPISGINPRRVLITEGEYDKIFSEPDLFDDDDDDDDDDEDPFEALEEFQREAWELIEENERKLKTEAIRLADVVRKISIKRSSEENASKNVGTEEADINDEGDEEKLPEHPTWTDEFEFIRTVRMNIEIIVKSDRRMGIKGAIKKAKDLHRELNDLGNNRMAEVFERVVFEFEHTSPYQYAKLKKKYFV